MKPMFRSVPADHGEYDAHLLRASLQGPAVEIMSLQLKERHLEDKDPVTKYANPWGAVPWYLDIGVSQTDLTIPDFVADTRSRFEQVLQRYLPVPLRKNISSARTLLTHLAHTLVQYGVELHARAISIEELITDMRQDVKCIYPERTGAYVLETPVHPLWGRQGAFQAFNNGLVSFVPERRPTIPEKAIAKFLHGPSLEHDGPNGIMSEILTQVQPFLLWKDDRLISERSIALRQELRTLLEGDPGFGEATRTVCVELIVEEWVRSLTEEDIAVAGRTDAGQSAEKMIREHFSPEVIADRHAFAQRLPLLEQHTIQVALQTQGENRERGEADFDHVDRLWMQALSCHPQLMHLCDRPSMGLAYLAAFARFQPPEFFRGQL